MSTTTRNIASGSSNPPLLEGRTEWKYETWADELRSRIRRGHLRPGDRLPSHGEMKQLYGLSRPTVERIHNLLEQEGLIVREPRRGAFVATPKRPVSDVIGFLSPQSGRYERHPFTLRLTTAVHQEADRLHREMLLIGHTMLDEGKSPDWAKIGGMLTMSINEQHLAQIIDRLPPGMPLVTLLADLPDVTSVIYDDYQGGKMAVRHLLDLGHRRIAHLITRNMRVTRRRHEGFLDGLGDAGIQAPESWARELPKELVREKTFSVAAHEIMTDWLRTDWKSQGLTAIVAQNDEIALGIVEAIQDAGLRVPYDISVVGHDGTEIAEYFRPRLTTVEMPLAQIAMRGTQLLIEKMQKPLGGAVLSPQEIGESVSFGPRLQIGETTAPPPLAIV